jgi:branched-chain amino acid transport system substrate-binding protein
LERKKLIILGSICLILMLVVLPFISSCQTKEAAVKTLKIGFLAGLTGFGSGSLKTISEGAQLAEDWINDQGGITIKGETYLVDVILEDMKGDVDGTVAAANKLIYDDGCKFVGGSLMAHTNAAAASVTEPAKVLDFMNYNCAMPEELGPNTPYTFLVHAGSIECTTANLPYLVEAYPQVKTVVSCMPDDGQVPYNGAIVKKLVAEHGLTLEGDIIAWALDTVDFAPLCSKVLARNPDAVLLNNGWPQSTGAYLKGLREMGFTGPVVACCLDSAPEIMGVAGIEASTDFFVCNVTYDSPEMPPMVKKIGEMATAKYGKALPFHCNGFQGVWATVQAIEAAQSLDPTEVRDFWEKMDTMDTVYGPGRMGGLEIYGIRHTLYHPVPIQALVNGEVVHVKFVDTYRP